MDQYGPAFLIGEHFLVRMSPVSAELRPIQILFKEISTVKQLQIISNYCRGWYQYPICLGRVSTSKHQQTQPIMYDLLCHRNPTACPDSTTGWPSHGHCHSSQALTCMLALLQYVCRTDLLVDQTFMLRKTECEKALPKVQCTDPMVLLTCT